MKRRNSLSRLLFASAILIATYPACILVYSWFHVLKSDFEGGRHGQLDAYRHALASATVSYTLGEWAVNLTTVMLECAGKDSGKMDIHNNRIGADIGSKASSFREIEPTVREAVMNGAVDATRSDQITWLAASKWRDGRFW